MKLPQQNLNLGIWGLALGYFTLYIPYSVLTKTLSKGLLPGSNGSISGWELLPATAIATTVTLLSYITLMDGWHSLNRKQIRGWSVPIPRTQTLCSGLATATIIATTTLNYTFTGISILFALLLMRGGVLMMAPLVDKAFGRQVKWNSWVALVLSFLAIRIAFTDVDNYQLTLVVALNISAYLIGYLVRLQFMTRLAKSEQQIENRRFFLEETMVAAIALTIIPALLALIGVGENMQQLRIGFTTFLSSNLVLPALAIGFLYACLYFFGSHIYLDPCENTFAIPLNRCSSLMSGLVGSYGLTWLLGQKPPSQLQLLAAGIIIFALLVLGLPARRKSLQSQRQSKRQSEINNPAQEFYLFICGGNTSRSPMAQAFCNQEIARLLNLSTTQLTQAPVEAISAGLNPDPGKPMAEKAQQTLRHLGVPAHLHQSSLVCAEQVERASAIWCMTEAQIQTLVSRFPQAAKKTQRLDPNQDIVNPSGGSWSTYLSVGQQIKTLVCQRLLEGGIKSSW